MANLPQSGHAGPLAWTGLKADGGSSLSALGLVRRGARGSEPITSRGVGPNRNGFRFVGQFLVFAPQAIQRFAGGREDLLDQFAFEPKEFPKPSGVGRALG